MYRIIRQQKEYSIKKQLRDLSFLIIQFKQIGDVVLTLPVAQSIKRELGSSHVGFLVERPSSSLVNRNPAVDTVHIREPKQGIMADLRLIRSIRSMNYDVVIDCIKTPSSGWFSLLSTIPVRIAMDHPLRRYFYTITIKPELDCGYAVDEKLVLLKAMGFSPYEGSFRTINITPDEQSIFRVKSYISDQIHLQNRPIIVIAPTSKRVTRRWPYQYFSRLIDLFYEHRKTSAIIVWGPGEEEFAQEVATACHSPVSVFFRSSLLELMALLSLSDFFIGNDSAPRHLAVSQNIPTITIHGATGIGAWTPPEQKHLAFSSRIECQPCNKKTCSDVICLQNLKPEDILERSIDHFDRFIK